jgi:hypothetical protein
MTFLISLHMRKLYGNAIRKEAGITKTLRKVATKNARRAPPELQRVYKEVQGTFEKFYEETAEAFEEFLGRCMRETLLIPLGRIFADASGCLAAPLVTHYVQDTKCLIQQSREKLLITWASSMPCVFVAPLLKSAKIAGSRRPTISQNMTFLNIRLRFYRPTPRPACLAPALYRIRPSATAGST